MTSSVTSTSAFFERSNADISSLRARAEEMQQQLSKGQKLSKSSDDPVAASRLRTLNRAESLSNIDSANADRANADLTLADSALSSFADFITRAQELSIQASNASLSPSQRQGIGLELQQIAKSMVALANSRDSAGHALFGGEATGNAYSVDASGNASYIGTSAASELPLGDGLTVQRGITGPEFLNFSINGNQTDLLAEMKALSDALIGGTGDTSGTARSALDALGAGLDSVTAQQTIVGARLSWIDMTTERRTNMSEIRSNEESEIGSPDIASTIANLQQIMLVLDASQSSFAQLSKLSLFNMIN